MTTERTVEIPWALTQLPQEGRILDVGSSGAGYLGAIQQAGRELHCLDPRPLDPRESLLPSGAVFHQESLIGNDLPRAFFDAALAVSTIEHIGLPCYGQEPFPDGDKLALAEIGKLLKPGAPAIATVPVGQSKLASWYRQYSAADLHRLFVDWHYHVEYWGYDGGRYRPIEESDLPRYDYRDRHDGAAGAGAVACIVAWRRL
ncbi:MAG TPA: hypothetical protein VHQ90_11075 [Thermoanaerobaculia bacterium]|nr:hypothetical protein [Thermoanaerobaculia bacterium]